MFFTSTPQRWPDRLRRIAVVAALACGLCGVVDNAHAGYAALVVDGTTGEVLNAVNADEVNHPASLTKMMTLYMTFQALQNGSLKLDQALPVSASAAAKAPTKLGLRAGQTITVRDCILGMVTKSANDAATVVAEQLGGTEERFVEMMNAQSLLLGMTQTRFGSASGLPDPDDGTTARDISKLAMALYRDFPTQSQYFATREFTFRGQVIRGHNRLMDRYPGMDGLKTGFTNASGFNLASTAVRDGHRLFGVVLGGRTSVARDDLMARLLNDGFDHQQTPASLVAAAGVPDRGVTRRILSALSPISTAEAEPAPVIKRVAASKRAAKKPAASRIVVSKQEKASAPRRRALAAQRADAKCSVTAPRRSQCAPAKSSTLAANQTAKLAKQVKQAASRGEKLTSASAKRD
jgi:D-alanyl-D-alanine carboxypeptidase/D-alanyl-D-alanine carboxypeptidase (penicillin-binding protein 5/6)